MMDSWGNLKVSGEFHPKRRQVCSLCQKEAEAKLLSSKYSDDGTVKLLPLPQPQLRARMDTHTNPSAQIAAQLRSVLACVHSVSRQNQNATTVP
jgi:hypothetical protein